MRLLLVAFCILISWPLYAATYYVSPASESTNWSGAQSIDSPCTAATAMSNAAAGDIVYFRGGTYVVTQAAAYHAALEPTNSGSAGNPITFQAYTGESPIIDVNLTGESHYGIGTNNKDYIIWDGFEVYGNGGTHMGGCMVGGESASTNLIIRNCTFHGGGHEITHTDNAELLRIEKTSHATIQNCLMYNARQVNGWHNTSAIKAYHNINLIIENCDIYNTTNAIYLKSDNSGAIVRNNWIHDNGYGIYVAVFDPYSTDNCQFYNNVIANSERTSIYVEASGSATANNYKFYNNTIYAPNNTGLSIWNAHGWDIYNNIIYLGTSGTSLYINANSVVETCDHNEWGSAVFSIYNQPTTTTYSTLADWQASTVLLNGASPGVGDSRTALASIFVNTSGNLNTLADFQIGASCVGAGRSGDIGADVSLVGTGAESGEDPPAPSGTATIRASGTVSWH